MRKSKVSQLIMGLPSGMKVYGLVIILFTISTFSIETSAERCKPEDYVYGENDIIDQLMVCSLAKSFDLDLTPQGDYVKNTPKALVEQGFSNKTSILYAKLNGIWSSRRANFVETGWRCQSDSTSISSVIEVSGLSLEIAEKVDVPIHRNQHKLAMHKPCKTFDLPLWMCRQSKPIYRTTKTWVNRAYFNLTLTQQAGSSKPIIERLSLLFTCPETFRQKITHSPSATYILVKHLQTNNEISSRPGSPGNNHGHKQNKRQVPTNENREPVGLAHPVSHHSTQDGRGPALPPYHNTVNLIINQVSEVLRSSMNDCIQTNDVDLSLLVDNQSFSSQKYSVSTADADSKVDDISKNQCSNKNLLTNRIEIANQAVAIGIQEDQKSATDPGSHAKRSQMRLKYPTDPNQLLNPYGYYEDTPYDEVSEETSRR